MNPSWTFQTKGHSDEDIPASVEFYDECNEWLDLMREENSGIDLTDCPF